MQPASHATDDSGRSVSAGCRWGKRLREAETYANSAWIGGRAGGRPGIPALYLFVLLRVQ